MSKNIRMNNFIKSLIVDTLEGIVSAELENQQKALSIIEASSMKLEDFIKKYIKYEDVRQEILRLFPQKGSNEESLVDEGKQYSPKKSDSDEQPAILNLIGYEMNENIDYILREDIYEITSNGYENIFNAVTIKVGELQKYLLATIASRGVPKILINSGEIESGAIITLKNKIESITLEKIICKCYRNNFIDGVCRSCLIESFILGDFSFSDMQLICESDVIVFITNIDVSQKDLYKFIVNNNSKNNVLIKINGKEDEDDKFLLQEGTSEINIIYYNRVKEPIEFNLEYIGSNGERKVIEKILSKDDNSLFTKDINEVYIETIKDLTMISNVRQEGLGKIKINYLISRQ